MQDSHSRCATTVVLIPNLQSAGIFCSKRRSQQSRASWIPTFKKKTGWHSPCVALLPLSIPASLDTFWPKPKKKRLGKLREVLPSLFEVFSNHIEKFSFYNHLSRAVFAFQLDCHVGCLQFMNWKEYTLAYTVLTQRSCHIHLENKKIFKKYNVMLLSVWSKNLLREKIMNRTVFLEY